MSTKTITLDQELTVNGITYWVEAEVDVHGVEESTMEARPFWGAQVYERVVTFTPTECEIISIRISDIDDTQEYPATPQIRKLVMERAMYEL